MVGHNLNKLLLRERVLKITANGQHSEHVEDTIFTASAVVKEWQSVGGNK